MDKKTGLTFENCNKKLKTIRKWYHDGKTEKLGFQDFLTYFTL